MTKIVNLYGGPGTGKSTSAAYLFYLLKKAGQNAELVREYVKKWAWENRQPSPTDQPYFLAKQARDENILLGKVDYIVTDSPVLLSVFYARRYAPKTIVSGIEEMVRCHYRYAAERGHQHIHVFLKRTKPYNPKGRFQTEEEARDMDPEVRSLISSFQLMLGTDSFGEIVESGTEQYDLTTLIANDLA